MPIFAGTAMRRWICLFLLAAALPVHAGTIHTDVPQTPDPARVHVIYLHGRIVENAGPRPTDPRFGPYDYPGVLEALSARGAVVISAQRAPGTDVDEYAGTVVSRIERLVGRGVPPGNIVVVGFSKGGGIAMRVSSFLRRPEVGYVLLAACPHGAPAPPPLRLTGRVLSVYESSDTLAGPCVSLSTRPEKPASFGEMAISTGTSHGAFYRPLPAWVDPVLDWIHGGGRRAGEAGPESTAGR